MTLWRQLIEGVGAMARLILRDDQWERIKDLPPGKATDCGYVIAELLVPGRQICMPRAHKQGARLFFAEQAIFTVNVAARSG